MNLADRVRGLPAERQRLLAVGMLAVALLVLPALVLGPLLAQHRQYAQSIDQSRDRIERTQHALDRLPQAEAEVAALEQALRQSELYIQRSAPALGAADLQQMLGDMARRQDLSIVSSQVLPPQEDPLATRIAVRINFLADIEGLAALLSDIENHLPVLQVQTIQVQVVRRRGRAGPGGPEATLVDVRLEVAALMRMASDS